MGNNQSFKMKLSLLETRSECPICAEVYHWGNLQPMIICQNHHHLCQSCLIKIEDTKKCPFCKTIIDGRIQSFSQSNHSEQFWWESKSYLSRARIYPHTKLQEIKYLYIDRNKQVLSLLILNLLFWVGNYWVSSSSKESLCMDSYQKESTLLLRNWLYQIRSLSIFVILLFYLFPIISFYFGLISKKRLENSIKVYLLSEIMKCWLIIPLLWNFKFNSEQNLCENYLLDYLYLMKLYCIILIIVSPLNFMINLCVTLIEKNQNIYLGIKLYFTQQNFWMILVAIVCQIVLLVNDLQSSHSRILISKIHSAEKVSSLLMFYKGSTYLTAAMLVHIFYHMLSNNKWQSQSNNQRIMRRNQMQYLICLMIKSFVEFAAQYYLLMQPTFKQSFNIDFSQYFSITMKLRAVGFIYACILFVVRRQSLQELQTGQIIEE